MIKITRQPIGWERCPYLGLHDDSSTCLAYASPWNYCYRATPPASVRTSHQDETCLCGGYVDCPVYVPGKWVRLPRALRGRVQVGTQGTRLRLVIGIIVLAAVLTLVVYLLPRYLP